MLSGFGAPDFRAYGGLRYTVKKQDADDDGIDDDDDACPDEPEDVDGTYDSDGCPDLDNDGDGITDRLDACPARAEDLDGDRDRDGCPDGESQADAENKTPS